MNDKPRKILCKIVTQHGRDLWEEPRRVEGILKDLCGDCPAEVAALVGAARQRVPQDLTVSSDNLPWVAVSVRYVQRLVKQMALSEEAARWAVDTWALALGRISEQETVPNVKATQVTPQPQLPDAKPAPKPLPIKSQRPLPAPPVVKSKPRPLPAPPVVKPKPIPRPRYIDDEDDDNDDENLPRRKRLRQDIDDQQVTFLGIRIEPAKLSMILGIAALVSIFLCSIISPPIAGVLGTLAIRYGYRGSISGNKSQAQTGIICGFFSLGLASLVLLATIIVYVVLPLAKTNEIEKKQDIQVIAKHDISEERILSNKASNGKLLEAPDKNVKQNGGRVQLRNLVKDNQNQRWQIVPFGDDQFLIICKANGLALEANSDNKLNANGSPVKLGTLTSAPKQQWGLEKVGEYVRIINRANGKFLEVHPEDVFKNGGRIQLGDENNADRCLWKILNQ